MAKRKKYIDTEFIKYYLNNKFDPQNYQGYKDYLDASLSLNNDFHFGNHRKNMLLRQASVNSPDLNNQLGFVKVAFDTRKINQETQFNPRRGLQNYNRSQNFIDENNKEKLQLLKKLNQAVGELKEKYGREEEWQDSYARVLCGVIEKTFNKIKKSGDITDAQPSVGSLDYIEELLYVRYRLSFDNVKDLDNFEIKKIILSKDESLIVKPMLQDNKISTGLESTSSASNDNMLLKLFGDIKATADNKSVERTVTITIKDTILDNGKSVKIVK